MTKEELIECKNHLELLKSEIEWDKPIGYQIDLDIAIEALEKQIPKRPEDGIMEVDDYEHNIKRCPCCGDWVGWDYKSNHCCQCGQALDWREE